MQIKMALDWAAECLSVCENPTLEAGYLICAVLKKDRGYLYAHFDELMSEDTVALFKAWLAERAKGMPLAYLVGEKDFWEYSFLVNEHTLIPRPETELLIEAVLQYLPENPPRQVADLGTGSGAIAVVIKKMRAKWNVVALDKSKPALQVAKENAKRIGADITFLESEWSAALADKSMDALLSNPPYIKENDPHLIQEIAFEPREALVAGKDGLDAYRAILKDAHRVLKLHGYLFLEHGAEQAAVLSLLLQENGFQVLESISDHQGHFRILVARL